LEDVIVDCRESESSLDDDECELGDESEEEKLDFDLNRKNEGLLLNQVAARCMVTRENEGGDGCSLRSSDSWDFMRKIRRGSVVLKYNNCWQSRYRPVYYK